MLKVLIAEDEEIIRKGLIASLDWERFGCSIIAEAEDGGQGLDLILKLCPDLVISDIRMPVLSGIEMVERAKEVCSFRTIFISSYADFEYAKKGIELKIDKYLLKPVDEEELEQAISEIEKEFLEQEEPYGLEIPHSGKNYYVEKTCEIIRDGYKGKLSIAEVSEQLNVSSSYLSRTLKKHMNMSFNDVLNRYRIAQAARLIAEGGRKVYEVSDELGFCDYKHFCTVFKKYMGMSPREFIKINIH